MAELLTTASVLQCPHGGSVSISSTNTHAKAGGSFILRPSDTFTISGCPFTLPGPTAHPCVRVEWVVSALKSKAAGDATLTKDSTGMCMAGDNAPQGTVSVSSTQSSAKGK
jgi:hypothetical protein